MKYVHVRSIDKYHPGYKDRPLTWAKIRCAMVQGDPDCEMIIDEVDWARLIKFILLELQAQKPIPIDPVYLTKKGFNLKKRPIQLTLDMLRDFLEVRNESVTETCIRVDKSRVEECNVTDLARTQTVAFEEVWALYPVKRRLGKKAAFKHYCATVTSKALHLRCKRAVENYLEEIEEKETPEHFVKHGSTFFNNWNDYYLKNPLEVEDEQALV